MSNIITYNSWKDKAPFGAILNNTEVSVVVYANENYKINKVEMVIFKEDTEVERVDLNQTNKYVYEGNSRIFIQNGLYFYHFEVEVQEIDYTYTAFYGKNSENGKSIRYYDYDEINKYQITVHDYFEVPSWYKEGILYNIFVDKFNNGNRNNRIDNPKKNSFIYANWEDTPMYIKDKNGEIERWDFHGGNLQGIINKLGYLKKLGISIIYLNPIFESRSNHKYDTGDYKKIDSMFGGDEVFIELIKKAKEKGISIILDGVFSHTGADSKYFNKYNTYQEIGAYQSQKSRFSEWFKFTNFPDEYDGWWGVKDLPNTNELNQNFMNYIIHDSDSVLNKWIDSGIKGFRLDVADELPTKFIREFKKQLKEADNDSVLIGEVWEDASNKISYDERRTYLQGYELDSVMGYPFRNNVLAFLKGNITSTQLVEKFMTLKENYPKESYKSNLNLIGSHDVTRIKTELNEDINMIQLAVFMQMTSEGVPYIYYGDEAGLVGGVDPDNRRTYPWKNEDEDMMNFYKKAISTRNRYKSLLIGETEFIETNDDDVFGYIRYKDEEAMLILINRGNDKNLKLNLNFEYLEEVDINYSNRKYLEITHKENKSFNIQMKNISYKIFNIL